MTRTITRSERATQVTAGEPLTLYRAAVEIAGEGFHFDPTNSDHLTAPVFGVVIGRINGTTLHTEDIAQGSLAAIQTVGDVAIPAGSLTTDERAYATANGVIGTSGERSIGWGRSATNLWIDSRLNQHRTVTETFTLSGTDIANKFILLGQTPIDVTTITAEVRGQGNQTYAQDFISDAANPKKIRWNSLGLDGPLVSGDVIVVRYKRA